jgi:hypothetical protein
VLAVNGGLETWFMYREITQLISDAQSDKAEQTARRIEQFISEIERQLFIDLRSSIAAQATRLRKTANAIAQLDVLASLAKLAAEKNVALVSDEIYKAFCYDHPFVSPAKWNDQTIVIDGFSKSHSMTGWRIGWVHGPQHVIQQMLKLQQFTFVCAPHPVQYAGLVAWDYDVRLIQYFPGHGVRRTIRADQLIGDAVVHGHKRDFGTNLLLRGDGSGFDRSAERLLERSYRQPSVNFLICSFAELRCKT